MEKLPYEIKKEYNRELNEIGNLIRQLKNGRIYEISNVKMDGYLCTNAEKLESAIGKLLSKIQNGENGFEADIAKWFL